MLAAVQPADLLPGIYLISYGGSIYLTYLPAYLPVYLPYPSCLPSCMKIVPLNVF